MPENQWEDFHTKADYSCDPYTYYFLWSNFGSRDYNPNEQCSSRSYSSLNFVVGFLILILLSIFGF